MYKRQIKTSRITTDDDSRLGVTVSELTSEQRSELDNVESGVIVTLVDPEGVAALAGIVKDDILVSFNQQAVDSVETLATLVREAPAGDPVAVLIHRNNSPLFTALTLAE